MTDRPATVALPRADRTDWWMVVLALGLGALAAYQQFKLPPVLPLLLDAYGYERVFAGGFMSIYAAVGLALSAVIGATIERQGFRRALVASGACFLAGSGLTMIAPALAPVVLVARGIEGVGFAILAVLAPVLATGAATPRHLPMAIAIFAAWIPTGQLVATMLAVPIAGAGEWRPLWWIGIGLTIVLGLIAWRRTGRVSAHITVGGRLRLARLQWLGLILNAAVFTLWSTELFAFMTWLPTYLVEQRGLSFADMQWPYAVPVAGILVFSIFGGYLLRAGISFITLMVTGLGLQAAVWFAMPWLGDPAVGLLAVALFGVGAGITPTGLFAGPSAMLGQASARGLAYGIIMTGRNTGVLLGPVLLPLVHDWLTSWEGTGRVFGGVAALGALSAGGLGLIAARIGAATSPQAAKR
ncbi:MAG: MFS transporter [Alphaproteobacteria bacterium]